MVWSLFCIGRWKISAGLVPLYAQVKKLGSVAARHLESDLEGSIEIPCSSEVRTGTCGWPQGRRRCELGLRIS